MTCSGNGLLTEVPTEPPPIGYARPCPSCTIVSAAIATMVVRRDRCVAFYCQACDTVFDESTVARERSQ